jgi:hypothetical protein
MAIKTRSLTKKHREAIGKGITRYHNKCRVCIKKTRKASNNYDMRKIARDKRFAEIVKRQQERKAKAAANAKAKAKARK